MRFLALPCRWRRGVVVVRGGYLFGRDSDVQSGVAHARLPDSPILPTLDKHISPNCSDIGTVIISGISEEGTV